MSQSARRSLAHVNELVPVNALMVKTTGPLKVALATNNGDIGGGEVMLLNIAQALIAEGIDTTIVGPSEPSALVDAAQARGIPTVTLTANSRWAWMWALRRWDRHNRAGILWANGLVPAVATAGRPNRVVHLHQEPRGALKFLVKVARRDALVTVVPSQSMQRAIPGSRVFANWVERVEAEPKDVEALATTDPTIVGFLGRPSLDKGVDVLAGAMALLEKQHPGEFRLLLAGEPRFVSADQRRAVEEALRPVSPITDLPGWLTPHDFFSRVDVFVCPSVWPEPFGLVVAEAMSAKVPVIVSDAGALPELMGPHSTNIVPAGDPVALAAKIMSLRDSPDATSVELLFRRWHEEYSPECGQKAVRTLLSELVPRP